MSSDERFVMFFTSAAWVTILVIVVMVSKYNHDIGYVNYGSKGHACFANHTCRENLKCLVADGIDATCVKP